MKRLLICILALGIMLAGCATERTGTLTMQLTDAPTGLAIEKTDVVISKVQVHAAGTEASGNNTSNYSTAEPGWSTIMEGHQTFDLMELQGKVAEIGTKELPAGKYTQVRLTVESATVTINGTAQDLAIPSGVVKLNHPFDIVENATTTLTLDFNASESIKETGNGRYMMRPTIRIVQT